MHFEERVVSGAEVLSAVMATYSEIVVCRNTGGVLVVEEESKREKHVQGFAVSPLVGLTATSRKVLIRKAERIKVGRVLQSLERSP